jgi:hypothetical protein
MEFTLDCGYLLSGTSCENGNKHLVKHVLRGPKGLGSAKSKQKRATTPSGNSNEEDDNDEDDDDDNNNEEGSTASGSSRRTAKKIT